MQNLLNRWHPEKVAEVTEGTLQYVLTDVPDGESGAYHVTFSAEGPTISEGLVESPTTTFTMSYANFLKKVDGTLDTMGALAKGDMKVTGDFMFARRLYIAHKEAVAKGTLNGPRA